MTDRLRLESLENWILQQSEEIKDLSDKKSEKSRDPSSESFGDRIETIESELKDLKQAKHSEGFVKEYHEAKEISLKCEHCDLKFTKAILLETHMVHHGLLKKHACKIYGKECHLKWRLEKHLQIHSEDYSERFCHYFNNGKECPFYQI